MKKYVVILAAGSSTRFGSVGVRKQFVEVGGKSLLEHSVKACDCGLFDGMVVVVPGEDVENVSMRLRSEDHSAPLVVVAGGDTRVESCMRGIDAIADNEAYVVVHNGAQPLVPRESLENCLRGLESSEAVVTSVPCVYTVMKVDPSGRVTEIPDRATLRNDMGEEGFRLSILRKVLYAHGGCKENTSMIRMVLNSGLAEVLAVDGSFENIKVTYGHDMEDVRLRLESQA